MNAFIRTVPSQPRLGCYCLHVIDKLLTGYADPVALGIYHRIQLTESHKMKVNWFITDAIDKTCYFPWLILLHTNPPPLNGWWLLEQRAISSPSTYEPTMMESKSAFFLSRVLSAVLLLLAALFATSCWGNWPSVRTCQTKNTAWSPIPSVYTSWSKRFFPRATIFTESSFLNLSAPLEEMEARWANYLPGMLPLRQQHVGHHGTK